MRKKKKNAQDVPNISTVSAFYKSRGGGGKLGKIKCMSAAARVFNINKVDVKK